MGTAAGSLACCRSLHLTDPGKPSDPRTPPPVRARCAGDTPVRLVAHGNSGRSRSTRPANRSGRRRTSRFSRVCSPALALPQDRARAWRGRRGRSARRPCSCGNGAELIRPGPGARQPNIARFAGVSARFTSIPSAAHTVIPASSTADGSSSADQRPGRLPEQGLHHVRRHQQPPVRDHLLRRDMPFQGERDVREQPAQGGPATRSTTRPASGSSRSSAG